MSARTGAVLVGVVAWLATSAVQAGPTPGTTPPALMPRALAAQQSGPPVPAARAEAVAASGDALPRVSFVTAPGGSIRVQGTYPSVPSPCIRPFRPVLRARYSGTIEVGRDTDGTLFLIAEIPFDDYLGGIAEVPRTWPMAALKAQVVAARSYALATMGYPDEAGDRLGYDLCATQACQVFVGWAISHGPYGDRWTRAVRQTGEKVLLYQGRPATTFYFSTSPGYTVGNEEVFGGNPLPYLRPVVERDDGASPYSRWRVELPDRDVARFLRVAGDWGSGPVSSVSRKGSDVVVSGGGSSRRIDVADFRRDLNFWAPCKAPDSYPTVDADGVRLAQTIPSIWFDTESLGGRTAFDGRGWGHGVGLVQWGAYGKARRGLSAPDILAAYYGGFRPRRYPEPDTIRVGIATGLQTVTVVGDDGPVSFTGRGPARGPWEVRGGKALRVRPGVQPRPSILPGTLVRVPRRLQSGAEVTATVSVLQRSVVSLVARSAGEDEVTLAGPATFEAGTATLSGTVPEMPSGTYRVRALVTDGVDIVPTGSREVRVVGLSEPSPSASPSPASPAATPASPSRPPRAIDSGTRGGGLLPIMVGVGVVAAVAAAAAVRRRRRRTPASGPPPPAG